MPAKIVVVEGPDKVGKETQSKLLADTLSVRGLQVVRLEPTKQFAYGKKAIYSMLESGAAKRYPNLFQFVQFINRLYIQLFKLPKLVRENDIVILDRWALSGFIYGQCEGINPWLNEWFYNRAKRADLVLVFSGTSYRRTQADDSYEKDAVLQTRVKNLYRVFGQAMTDHVLLDNVGSVTEVHQRVIETLEDNRILPPPCSVCQAHFDEDCDAGYHS